MVSNATFKQVASKLKRQMGRENLRAVVGDENGVIYHTQDKTKVRVRIQEASGLSKYIVVRCNASVKLNTGSAVWVGYDLDDEYTILKADYEGQIAQGANPLVNNGSDSNINAFNSQGEFLTGLTIAMATGTTPSTEVVVREWYFLQNGSLRQFVGQRIDLASYIPASGFQCLACIFLKSDNTIEVVASTDKNLADVLTIDEDIIECWQGATPGSIPMSAWRLSDAQTTVVSANQWLDLRGLLNIDDGNTSDTDWEVLQTPYLIPSGRRKIMSEPEIGLNGTLEIAGTLVLI